MQHGARRRSARLRSALLAFTLLTPFAAPASAQIAPGYEEGIMEVVAERLPALTTLVLVDSAGSVLLPLDQIVRHLGLEPAWSGATLSLPGLDGTMRVDTALYTMRTALGTVQLAPAEMVVSPTIYLRDHRLAELLDADIVVDFATLTATITRSTPFPAQQRIMAEQRRALLLARQRQLEERGEHAGVPYRSITGVGTADWEVTTSSLDPAKLTTLRASTGVAILGGDLNGGAAFEAGRDARDHVRDATVRFYRVFPQGKLLTQFRAGDVLTSGLFARYMRGVELSNQPFLRSAELTSVLVDPDLPTGWQYEVFQGNQLLGYSDIGSTDPVSVPLRAGSTPVQVRMFGPAGEEVVSTLIYQAPISLLRRNAVEYAVGGGRCTSACESYAHADVRYGATSLLTVGGGFELLEDSAGRDLRPYFIYSLTTGTRATAEITYMPFALYSANVSLFPRDGSSAHVRGSISRPGFGPVSLVRSSRMRWDSEILWDERNLDDALPFSQMRFGASAAGMLGGLERWRLSAIGSFSRGYTEMRYDHDRISLNRHLVSGRGAMFLPLTIRGHTLRPLVSAALGISDNGFQLGEAGVSIQPRQNAVVSAAVQWSRGSSRPTLSLGYSAHLGSVQTSLRAVSSASGVASSSLSVSGSTSIAPDGSFTFQPLARTGYAGVHGTVFVDQDGDGVFSDGDTPVPDIHVIVAGHRAVSNEDGRFNVWGLQPYQPATIAVDSARTPDPSWTARQSALVVRPVPNVAMSTDIQLVRTRELVGTLTAAPGVATVAGVTLHITDVQTGEVVTTTTFSDGMFYVSRMRPGRYRLTVAPSSLDVLRASTSPDAIEFEIEAAGEELLVELAPLQLEPRSGS